MESNLIAFEVDFEVLNLGNHELFDLFNTHGWVPTNISCKYIP